MNMNLVNEVTKTSRFSAREHKIAQRELNVCMAADPLIKSFIVTAAKKRNWGNPEKGNTIIISWRAVLYSIQKERNWDRCRIFLKLRR
mgnify:CR=1 FL=1